MIVQATRLYKRYRADPVSKPLLGLLHSGVQNGLFCTRQVAFAARSQGAQIGGSRSLRVATPGAHFG